VSGRYITNASQSTGANAGWFQWQSSFDKA
jgi:hypothetical protein